MKLSAKIFVINALLGLSINISANAQTRNVIINSFEADSIEKANFDNKNFHSEIKQFTSFADTAKGDYELKYVTENHNNIFCIEPVLELSTGFQSEPKDKLYNAIFGISATYNYKEKFTISSNILSGYTKPLETISLLADSIGYFPQFGYFDKNTNNYFLRYFEFYANYLPAKYLMVSFGKGKKSVGDGYRSMLFSSSNSGTYYFDLGVNAGGFNYTFSVNGAKSLDSESPIDKTKWIVYHFMSWNATKWLNLGIFESVTLTRRDSLNNSRFVDLHYLNPMVFTRPIEYSLGSPDNEIIGAFGKLKFLKSHCIYGQFVLDEFKLTEIKDKTGWWANKYSIQIGAKGFVKDFSYLAEYNHIRPYMYSHNNATTAYVLFSQPVANPYGANLKEFLFQLKYQKHEYGAEFIADFVEYGKDYNDKYSLGNNILRPYTEHKDDYNNTMCQGQDTKLINITLNLRYQPKILKNFYVFSQLGIRHNNDSDNTFMLIGIKTGQIFFDTSR